jgi:retron-type reverse transcriptase
MKVARNIFGKIASLEHLFHCWDHFRRGKRKRKDIQFFERHLEDNIFQLQHDLVTLQYRHEPYRHFYISDPKQRHISKATVRDRLVHEAVYQVLTEIFDKTFIYHSLSSRIGKGTHMGITQLDRMIKKVSSNGTNPCYALKMDIKRFFDTVNHRLLKLLIRRSIKDEKALVIIDIIIDSFQIRDGELGGMGIPLGNVTSQLFANIYLHELDDFIKRKLREKHYLRYCDDFIILSSDGIHLQFLIDPIREFLLEKLLLMLHPKKVGIRKLKQGIDFIGAVLFQNHRLVRTRTKQRMIRRLKKSYEEYLNGKMEVSSMDQKVQSYLGVLSHANQHKLSQAIKNAYWVRGENGKIPFF